MCGSFFVLKNGSFEHEINIRSSLKSQYTTFFYLTITIN
jgi:hypothetical protein